MENIVMEESKVIMWLEWLEEIQQDIRTLLYLQYVFKELMSIIDKNSKIQTDRYFYDWLCITYSTSIVIGIRRQLDKRSDVISLHRLLDDIEKSPKTLTFDRFEAIYAKKDISLEFIQATKNLARSTFSRFAGSKNHIEPSLVKQDISQLIDFCEPIRKYVNKRVAHHDHERFDSIPEYNDIDIATKKIREVFCEYYLLLKGEQFDWTDDGPLWDWKEIFTIPWIDSE